MKKLKLFFIFILILISLSLSFSFAQSDLDKIKEDYFKNHRYDEFVSYLKNLEKKEPIRKIEISYYIALSRYQQLKYLEETQNWDLYFKYGNDYKEELVKEAKKTIDLTSYKDKIHLYALSLLWRFYKDQQSPQEIETKKSLIEACSLYSKETDELTPIKEIADIFISYEDKLGAEKLYKLYTERLIVIEKDLTKLRLFASNALKENNLDLAIQIYDAYIERIIKEYPKEKLLNELISIAKSFSFKTSGKYNLEYAEKVFNKIESLYGNDIFDEETLYLRAYNLEKSLNYKEALKQYLIFLERFPESKSIQEITFKTAVISAYSLADLEKAFDYFKRLIKKEEITPYLISSLYQLGLISQWQNNYEEAKNYYNTLLEKAGNDFEELKNLAKIRLSEIENKSPIEYNLKTFLDLSFSKETFFQRGTLSLSSSDFKTSKGKSIEVSASVVVPESGCYSIDLNYLWSGELGISSSSLNQNVFSTSYKSSGTKLINLIVLTPTGILDKSYLMIDVE